VGVRLWVHRATLYGMTSVATIGPTAVGSRAVPSPMRHRNFRVDDATWNAALEIARLRDERISDVMRTLIRGYVSRNRKLLDSVDSPALPQRPERVED
jgi:hypothetical protein